MNQNDRNEKLRELCYIGDLELVRKHVNDHSPDLDSQNNVNGWTALHWASKKNHSNIIKFLLDKGASKDVKNKDGKIPAELSTDSSIRTILGGDHTTQDSTDSNKHDYEFVPNFKRYPEFHYADKSLFSESHTNSVDSKETNNNKKNETFKNPSLSSFQNNHSSGSSHHNKSLEESSMVTIKIRTNLDDDFVEIDLDPLNTSFNGFKEMCMREFADYVEINLDKLNLAKIRKLPDVLIRNTNDIKRLRNDQSVEFYFIEKNRQNLI